MYHILIIEDEDSLRQTLTDLLTFEGMRVSAAPNGEDGLRMVHESPPDLILCDIMMPGLDGYAVLRKLQLSERTALIPFIFLTAKADAQQVREGMELGADDYLCKPIAKAELLAAIRTRLWKQSQQRERIEHEVEAARQDVVRKLPMELLSPLTGLLSASQLLETADSNLPVAAIRELGRVTRLTSQRLHRMIRRFLLYAELQAACQQPEVQASLRGTTHIPATSLVSALAEHLARQYSRSADLCLDLQEVETVMDLTHFSELIAHLVGSAFRYSSAGSPVQVRLVMKPGLGCLLTIRDHGRGDSTQENPPADSHAEAAGGCWMPPSSGLGIALADLIAKLYGGRLELRGEPGSGTETTLRLPNSRPGIEGTGALTPELQQRVAWALGSP